jgi:hypothetical protein
MASTGFIVDVDNFDKATVNSVSTFPCSAVLHPFLLPVVSSRYTAQKPRSRQGAIRINPPQTTHGYSRRARYVQVS